MSFTRLIRGITEIIHNIIFPFYVYFIMEFVFFFRYRRRRQEYAALIRKSFKRFTANVKLCTFKDILPEPSSVRLENITWANGNITPYELFCVCAIVKYNNCKRIFEIGTFNGNTSLQMAVNSGDDSEIYTLDLEDSAAVSTALPLGEFDEKFILRKNITAKTYKNTVYEKKIRELKGDSATFNFSRFEGMMDLVFIDGGHSYEYVSSDTRNAFKILKPGGIIVWHDYTTEEGVDKFINGLGLKKKWLYSIENTDLVVYFGNDKGGTINAI